MVRKFKITILSLLLITMLSAMVFNASSLWYFNKEISTENTPGVGIENYKPNLFLNDSNENSVYTERKFYNAYFLSQAVTNVMDFLEVDTSKPTVSDGNTNKTNYKIKSDMEKPGNTGPYYIYKNNKNHQFSGHDSLGIWEPGTSYYSDTKYFKKITHVAEITNQMLSAIGQPTTKLCVDNDYVNSEAYFSGWFMNPVDTYIRGNSSEVITSVNNSNGFLKISRLMPTENFENALFNKSLADYDTNDSSNKVIYINGEASIIFYPNYYHTMTDYDNNNKLKRRDLCVIRDEFNQTKIKNINPSYDMNAQNFLDSNGVKKINQRGDIYSGVSPYLFTNLEITDDLLDHNYYIIDQSVRVSTNAKKEINTKNDFNLISSLGTGAYNIRVFVKHYERESSNVSAADIRNNDFTSEEINIINSYLDSDRISTYKAFNISSKEVTYTNPYGHKTAKSFYIVVEKLYALNIVGGENNSFDSLNQKSLDLKISLNSSDDLSQYILSGLSLDLSSNVKISYSYNGKTILIPNYYFSFLVNSGKDTLSSVSIPTEEPLDKNNKPIKYKYYDIINGFELREEPYIDEVNERSFSRFELLNSSTATDITVDGVPLKDTTADIKKIVEELHLVKPKETGVYNVFIEEIHSENETHLKLWGARFHDISVTIIDEEDDNVDFSSLNGIIEITDITHYSFKCDYAYYRNSDIRYHLSEGMTFSRGDVSDNRDLTGGTLLEIINQYKNKGKVLYDLTTGRILTQENLESNPFILSKSILLGVKSIN